MEPSYCIADREGYGGDDEDDPREQDEWWRYGDDADARERDDAWQQDDDSAHEGDYHDTENGTEEPINPNTLLTPDLIEKLIGDQTVAYLFNNAWLDKVSLGKDARGSVLYAGQTLPDGSIAQCDTIILAENATVGVLLEELFHIWQGKNCYNGSGFPNEATSAMELMDKVFDTIYDMIENGNYAIPSDGTYGSLSPDLADIIFDCFDFNDRSFDWEQFYDEWNRSFFFQWKETNARGPYGRGTDDDWEWNWRDAHDWWEHHRF